jgi:hypothetical protein
MSKSDYTFQYRIRNWPEYNRALVRRGQLTLWFSEDAIDAWRFAEPNSRPGRPRIYADAAIECALVLKSVFHLSLRATQGFLASLTQILNLDLPIPDYSTVSRRQRSLSSSLSVVPSQRSCHIVVDATGLKVFGAGEWHGQKHRRVRRRTWRKLHLGVDETAKEVVAVDVTASNVHDSRMLPSLHDQIPGRIGQVSGDRAYDIRACYESILERGAAATIPPRRNARVLQSRDPPAWRAMRNATLGQIAALGRYEWRVESGCTRQSLAENAVFRFKTLFGAKLSARLLENQQTEAIVKCAVLNRMTSLGMPDSVRIR